jgi:hypothetical protein
MLFQPQAEVKALLVRTLKKLAPNRLDIVEAVEAIGFRSFRIDARVDKDVNFMVEVNAGCTEYFSESDPGDLVVAEICEMWGIPSMRMDNFVLTAEENQAVRWGGGGYCAPPTASKPNKEEHDD